ncbi:MAG: SGNH/GDSL hydrolase family protein [Planctomycetota bacterium]
MKKIKKVIFITVPTFVFLFLVFEIFFRLILPACSLPHVFYNKKHDILHYDLAGPRQGYHTTGPFCKIPGKWKINNEGWNSGYEYKRNKTPGIKRIAVIGDSFVEGFNVDYDERLGEVLQDNLNDVEQKYEVYSFGFSGAPLSQYLNMSRYVREVFDPDIFVFLFIHNDFDESLSDLRPKRHFLQLKVDKESVREVAPSLVTPSTLRRMAGKSALVRYLWINLHVDVVIKNMLKKKPKPAVKVKASEKNEVPQTADKLFTVWEKEVAASEYVLNAIVSESKNSKVVFMMDGPRKDIYKDNLSKSGQMKFNNMVDALCKKENYQFLDLTWVFADRYRSDGRKFNSEYDYHWNELGHKIAAEEVKKLIKDYK